MDHLPSGTVTFVFTDIEASTRLFQQWGNQYPVALEDHRRLLRAAFTHHSGVELMTDGDGFFVAFANASDGLAACLEGQIALRAHQWPAGGEVRVRMGMHTGEAEPVQGDYVALAVHQAARIRAAGHGGQVLVSEVARRAIGKSIPSRAWLVALGAYRLKDFDEPQELYQLTHPDLMAVFPALRVLPAAAHNLPVSRTSFVGREADVSALAALVRSEPLVTITGPGGVGKTRLALELARQVLPAFPGGVRLVELASIADPAAVPFAVASVLGVREEPGRPLEETLSERLQAQATLLVLDNCEHVVEACARLVASLLRGVPDVRLLTTSREPIGVAGERVWIVAPFERPNPTSSLGLLAQQDAVRLFVERAVAVRRDFTLTDASGRAVAEICRTLDSLPLALELAAARVTTLTPLQIVSRLEKRLPLLGGGGRDVPERQRTLRAAIGWSYELLSESERKLFRRLPVFSGGCTLEAAENVIDAEIDPLQSLVEKNLIRSMDGRFSMLETIREFALDQLEKTGEADELRRRHAEHFGAVAPELGLRARRSDPVALEQVDAEYDNWCGALDWALTHGDFELCEQLVEGLWYLWLRRGLTDGYRSALAALRASPAPSPDFLATVGELARYNGELERAVELKRRAVAAFEAGEQRLKRQPMTTRERIASARTDLAETLIELGQLDEAEREAERALALREEDGASFGIAHARVPYIMLELERGNYERAAALSDRSILTFSASGRWHDAAYECVRSAAAYRQAGEIALARARLREGFRYAIDTGEAAVKAVAIEQAAALAAVAGDDETALRLFGASRAGRKFTGYVFRTDESALTMSGARIDSRRRDALLDEGASWDLEEATRRVLEFLSLN